MRRFISFLLFISMSIASLAQTSPSSQIASAEQERVYLVQIVNQLNAMIPSIIAAEKLQPRNQRVMFHYSAWRDPAGRVHNGLLEDVQSIKKGIEEKLNTVSVEPRVVQPIRGDYLGQTMDSQAIVLMR